MQNPSRSYTYPVVRNQQNEADYGTMPPETGTAPDTDTELRLLRQAYDPTGELGAIEPEDFFDRIAATRNASFVRGLGWLSAREVVLAEAVDLDLHVPYDMLLPHSEERRERIVDARRRYARHLGDAVIEVADQEIYNWHTRQRQNKYVHLTELPSRLVMTGKVASIVSHEGQKRRSGRDYYAHPDDVSSILRASWRRQMGAAEAGLRDLLSYMAYNHDGPEDTLDAFGAYLAAKTVITPLTHRIILEAQDVAEAADAVRTLFLMMRSRDTSGNRMEYNTGYIERGVNYGGLASMLFDILKCADNHQNLSIEPDAIDFNDPKVAQKISKKHQYEDSIIQILRGLEAYELRYAMVAHTMPTISTTEVSRAGKEKYPLNHKAIVKAVRKSVSLRQDLQAD